MFLSHGRPKIMKQGRDDMEWMTLPLKRYFDFAGRSRRKEFWMWVLGVVIVTIVLSLIDTMLGLGGRSAVDTTVTPDGLNYSASAWTSGGWLTNLFALAILIPNLAVGVRRLHDTGRSGWWIVLPMPFYLVGLVAAVMAMFGGAGAMAGLFGVVMFAMPLGFLCALVLLVFFCLEGTRGPNRYGPDPKASENAPADGQALN